MFDNSAPDKTGPFQSEDPAFTYQAILSRLHRGRQGRRGGQRFLRKQIPFSQRRPKQKSPCVLHRCHRLGRFQSGNEEYHEDSSRKTRRGGKISKDEGKRVDKENKRSELSKDFESHREGEPVQVVEQEGEVLREVQSD